LQLPAHYDYATLRHTPLELRSMFKAQNWDKVCVSSAPSPTGFGLRHNLSWCGQVVFFQTRNPLHRAHFELTQRAIDGGDGAGGPLRLVLHPVVGETKPGDIDHHTRVKCYRAIMHRYQPGTALLSALPLAMRMV
jgi:sulfate adenylyltransferase